MSGSTYFVRGESKSLFEGMTKEQILAAITQAVEDGTVGDIDTGFITKIKEINKGYQLRFWVGTSAEYNAIETPETNVLYIKTDDTSAADISAQFVAIAQQIAGLESDLEEEKAFSLTWARATEELQQFFNAHLQSAAQNVQRITAIERKDYLPVGAVFMTSAAISTAEDVATAVGFGTWESYGTIAAGANTINCWLRTE